HGALRHAYERAGNLRRLTGFAECLYEELWPVIGFVAPCALANFQMKGEDPVFQFAGGRAVLVREDWFRHLRTSRNREQKKQRLTTRHTCSSHGFCFVGE